MSNKRHKSLPKDTRRSVPQRAASRHTRQAVPSHRAGGISSRSSHTLPRGAKRAGKTRRHVNKVRKGHVSSIASHKMQRSHSGSITRTVQHHTDTLSTATVNEVLADSEVHHSTDSAVTASSPLPAEYTTSTHQDEEPVHLLSESHFPVHEESFILVVNPETGSLDTALQQGLRPASTVNLSHLGISVVSLAVPDGGDASLALQNLQVTGVSKASLNTYYRLDAAIQPEKVSASGAVELPFSKCKPCAPKGRGVRIGMVDSRVDLHQKELSNQLIRCKNFISKQGDAAQTDHGTAIAKLLVGSQQNGFIGLVPNATLYAAAAFPEKSRDSPGSTVLTILKALDWLVSQNVQIINVSFSGPDNSLLAMAVAKIQELGIIVVAAAGNHGSQAEPAYPGAYKGVIAVTAVDQFKRPYRKANHGQYISFAAPGVRVPIPGRDGSVTYRTGTSFATPYATALLALLLSKRGKATTLPMILTRLKDSAEDLGAPGKDPVFGWGLLHCSQECTRTLGS